MEQENKVVRFDLFKIDKGREKLCRCKVPRFEIDTTNRLVICRDCGAVIEPFEALVTLCEHMARYEKYQEEAIEKANTYRAWAEKEWKRRFKNKLFKDMERQYFEGLFPVCPKCNDLIDPLKISGWANPNYFIKLEASAWEWNKQGINVSATLK